MKSAQAKVVAKGEKVGATPLKVASERAVIKKPNMRTVAVKIRGKLYVQNKFGGDQKRGIHEKQELGHQGTKGGKRPPKNFQALYENAKHKTKEGWCGIPAPAFRNGMISACKIIGFHMTKAKLAVFIEEDGYDAEDGTPLVKITKGAPEYFETYVRNETGVVDLRARPLWREWEATVRVRFDADMFSASDIANLMARVGLQVGIGEGRADSKSSNGMGWGTFEVVI